MCILLGIVVWTVDGSHFAGTRCYSAARPIYLICSQSDNQLVCIRQMPTGHAHMDPQDKAMNMNPHEPHLVNLVVKIRL